MVSEESSETLDVGTTRAQLEALRARVRGCLLGGALGDALGAGIEFLDIAGIRRAHGPDGVTGLVPAYGRRGAITDDTQMTLFTAEGLIRAWVRGKERGVGHPPAVVWHAYLRWLHTQGVRAAARPEELPEGTDAGGPEQSFTLASEFPDGELVREPFMLARRAPGNTCLAALASGRIGTIERPLNDSKGCGGVMRAAPCGLVDGPRGGDGFRGDPPPLAEIFRLGCDVAAITHGHPSGYLPAGVLAAMLHALLRGEPFARALSHATECLWGQARAHETLRALRHAIDLTERQEEPSPENVERLGAGWTGEEALAIAVYATLSHPQDVRSALLLAVNHSGDSDSTGAICGQILGTILGEGALPGDWLAELEGRETIVRVADDLVDEICDRRPRSGGVGFAAEPGWEAWQRRYPGW
jgi:ADP-ribosylglycohydrolase